MTFDEKNYPMTYKEFEKRVVELFLEDYTDDVMDNMIERVDMVLSEKPHNFLEQEYGYACFRYDSPDIFGEESKDEFTDKFLKQTPVSNLRKLIG